MQVLPPLPCTVILFGNFVHYHYLDSVGLLFYPAIPGIPRLPFPYSVNTYQEEHHLLLVFDHSPHHDGEDRCFVFPSCLLISFASHLLVLPIVLPRHYMPCYCEAGTHDIHFLCTCHVTLWDSDTCFLLFLEPPPWPGHFPPVPFPICVSLVPIDLPPYPFILFFCCYYSTYTYSFFPGPKRLC